MKVLTLLVIGFGMLSGIASADTLVFTNTHSYDAASGPGAIDIKVDVFNTGTRYKWQYTVTNHSFDPVPGTSNGFSGFELAMPAFVPDIADVMSPSAAWAIDCCSGLPVEWDISNSRGLGVMPGGVGVFSFTTLPRHITVSTGWFHSWISDSQVDVTTYAFTPGATGPEVPDVLRGPVPEPGTMVLLASGLVAAFLVQRRRRC